MYQFHEETDESHDAESDSGGDGNLLELPAVRLGAALDQSDRVLGERAAGFVEFRQLIHFFVDSAGSVIMEEKRAKLVAIRVGSPRCPFRGAHTFTVTYLLRGLRCFQ